jgi:hypothetical protein
MASKIKNIIIFVIIAAVFILIYIFFIKPSPDQASLVSSPSGTSLPNVNDSGIGTNIPSGNSLVPKNFLTLLLNVKNIKLNDAILSDPVFNSLRDSSIVLTPDGTEGRPNPFAQFGNDSVTVPVNNTLNTVTVTP